VNSSAQRESANVNCERWKS